MKNTFIQYQGGGYSGCFWEWNMGFFDSNENYHSIFHSGTAGCDTKDKIEHFIKRKDEGRDYFLYLMDKESIQDFIDNSNDGHVLGVAKWFHKHFPEFDNLFNWNCEECGRLLPIYQTHNSSYRGAGGLAIAYEGKICEDCECEETSDLV